MITLRQVLKYHNFFFQRTAIQPVNSITYSASEISEAYESDPFFHLGVYTASREFWKIAAGIKDDDIKGKKRLTTLYKYWIRACANPTPFGLFSHTSLGKINSGETTLFLERREQISKRVRIDLEALTMISSSVLRNPLVRKYTSFYTNNTLHARLQKWGYIEYCNTNRRSYKLSTFQPHVVLNELLILSKKGAKYIDMVKYLVANGMDKADAISLIEELIESKVIISELEPLLVTNDPMANMIKALKKNPHARGVCQKLAKIQQLLKNNFTLENCLKVEQLVDSFNVTPTLPIVLCDLLSQSSTLNIQCTVIDKIVNQVSDLLVISEITPQKAMDEFLKKFQDRYELQEIPLMDALDDEIGIGFGSDQSYANASLINDIVVPEAYENSRSSSNSIIVSYISEKYCDFLSNGSHKIEIQPHELAELKKHIGPLPLPKISNLLGNLVYSKDKDSVNNLMFALISVSQSESSRILARFAYAGTEINEKVGEIIMDEDNDSEVIYAEIVHLPYERIGNVMIHPSLRKYEIPLVTRSERADKYQILISDLFVSIANGEVILYSKRLNKRVIPIVTNAFNIPLSNLLVYRFLAAISTQHVKSTYAWNWGIHSMREFLPRVEYGNIIVCKARWIISVKDLSDLFIAPSKQLAFFEDFRAKRNIPRLVTLDYQSHNFVIDFKSEIGLEILVQKIKAEGYVQVFEFLFSDNSPVTSEEGYHVNEIMIPLKNFNITPSYYPPPRKNKNSNIKRNFFPGDNCLYVKVYCSYIAIDRIIRERLLQAIIKIQEKGIMEMFFFVRYEDPNPHLRLRFLYTKKTNRGRDDRILSILQEELHDLIASNVVYSMQIATYSREIERYGEHCIEHCEKLFSNDSHFSLKLLNSFTNVDADTRWLFLLKTIDVLLDDFGLELWQKVKILDQISESLYGDTNIRKRLVKKLNDKYRVHKERIFSIMSLNIGNRENFEAILFERSSMNKPVIEIIKKKDLGSRRITSLIGDLIHMHVNRVIMQRARQYEAVLYHFLHRYYLSRSYTTITEV